MTKRDAIANIRQAICECESSPPGTPPQVSHLLGKAGTALRQAADLLEYTVTCAECSGVPKCLVCDKFCNMHDKAVQALGFMRVVRCADCIYLENCSRIIVQNAQKGLWIMCSTCGYGKQRG